MVSVLALVALPFNGWHAKVSLERSGEGGQVDLKEHFAKARNVITLPPNEVLFRLGDPAESMFVILHGQLDILVSNKLVEIAGPGDVVGEMALVDLGTRSATVVTRTRANLVPIDIAHFDLLILEDPGFARHMMKVMVRRLRNMNQTLVGEQSLSSSTGAVAAVHQSMKRQDPIVTAYGR
jgi:CRP/FNR family cyclic AMP-dependent transcriptional regulator